MSGERSRGAGEQGAGGAGEAGEAIIHQCPMPNAQFPIPNSQYLY
ncbi:hypothetical protein [Nostoc sp.]